MADLRHLIVNADDFGLSPGVNRGVIRAHEQGVVTSASLMVRWPAASEAAAYGRQHRRLSLGLHCDLGEWACRDETWVRLYEVVPFNDAAAINQELEHQLATFRKLVGRDPTHLDSHQHVHREEPVRSLLAAIALRLGVPLRQITPHIHYCGDFYGQDAQGNSYPEILSVAGLMKILASLGPGWTELACHPGDGDATGLDSMYVRERAEEVNVLCDPLIRDAIAEMGIELRSFADVGKQQGELA
jgi:predicted glycoside hydrolase/deacetylase ChbG (UPF0249 family)